MTDDDDTLLTRIAAVQSAHQPNTWGCLCGWQYNLIDDYSHFDHVAGAVIEALGLHRVIDVNRSVPRTRYVTGWEADG